MSESTILQLLGYAFTLGGTIGYIRARLPDLTKKVGELSERIAALEKTCLSCLARLEREEKHDAGGPRP